MKHREDLEAELRSLVPKPPSDEVVKQIARRLVATALTHSTKRPLVFAPLVALAVGIVMVATWLTHLRDLGPSALPGVEPRFANTATQPPTVLAYRRVFVESPGKLDDLLDRHAAKFLATDSIDIESLYEELLAN